MHFPGKEYLEEVPEDQDEEGALEKADMLIAYRRQLLSERGKRVPLTFHHAFAMVQVKVKLPVGDNPAEGPSHRKRYRVPICAVCCGHTK